MAANTPFLPQVLNIKVTEEVGMVLQGSESFFLFFVHSPCGLVQEGGSQQSPMIGTVSRC
jgi:hypothetical protein